LTLLSYCSSFIDLSLDPNWTLSLSFTTSSTIS
jgi:hypothetical protein